MFRVVRSACVFILLFATAVSVSSADPSKNDVLAAMKKASAFMMDEVSTNGGFVWKYSADLTERWGEVPARPTQIWVQGATNGVGEVFLRENQVLSARGQTRFSG